MNTKACKLCENKSTSQQTSSIYQQTECIFARLWKKVRKLDHDIKVYPNIFNLLKMCFECERFDQNMMVVKSFDKNFLCCECLNKKDNQYKSKLFDHVKKSFSKSKVDPSLINTMKLRNINDTKNLTILDMLLEDTDNFQDNKIRNKEEEDQHSNFLMATESQATTTKSSSDKHKNSIIKENSIDWGKVTRSYFVADYSVLTSNLSMIMNELDKEPIEIEDDCFYVNFKNYLAKFEYFHIVKVNINEKNIVTGVFGKLYDNSRYRLLSKERIKAYLTNLTLQESMYISNLFKEVAENHVIDYYQFVMNEYTRCVSKIKSIVSKVDENIRKDISYYKKYYQTEIEAKKRLEYVQICNIVKLYMKIGNSYFDIEKDLVYYTNFIKTRISSHKNEKTQPVQSKKSHSKQLGNPRSIKNRFKNHSKTSKETIAIESDCSVCFIAETEYFNQIIYCSGCEKGTHLKCIGLFEVPSENFYCLTCSNNKHNKICVFCQKESYMLQQGNNGVVYHTFCACANKNWSFRKKGSEVKEIVKPKTVSCCIYCKFNKGIVNTCADCNEVNFHYFCGYLKGLMFKIDNYDQISFEDSINEEYGYSFGMYCETCTKKQMKNKKDLDVNALEELFLKACYYRNVCISPKFNKLNLDFDSYMSNWKK